MTITTDFHSHVSRSSAREMVLSAQQKGLHVLGLSEHIFQMVEARSTLEHMQLEGPLLTFSEYIAAVRAAGQDASVTLRLGLEVDFIPGKNEQIQAFLRDYDWDFLIGSVHEVNGLQIENKRKWDREEGEALWLRYMALLRAAVSSGYFSLVSHPVRMRVANAWLPHNLDQELEQLAAEAARCNVALEVNGYDVQNYPSLVRRLARACALHKTPVSVGSDAHNPGQIALTHSHAESILREVGIKSVRIWKQRAAEEYNI
ncbi:MAG TPA: PHP domain-containing protein [Ktedonobacteraceae bacterium]|nr:PHP domain-containing protein [Ktedonobacteraceae bacterium]